jgi:type IV pilus assembly protein PilE
MYLRSRGVTLIELMIVVVVVAILASIAVPSYRNYVLRAQRTEGTSALLRVRAAQEKFFLQNNRYATNAELATAPPGGLGIAATTESNLYALTVTTPDPTPGAGAVSFRVTATAAGAQLKDAPCQTFTLNDQGVRTSAPSAITTCWR